METMKTVGSRWLVQYAGSTCTATVEKVRKHYGAALYICRIVLNGRELVQTLNFRVDALTTVAA